MAIESRKREKVQKGYPWTQEKEAIYIAREDRRESIKEAEPS